MAEIDLDPDAQRAAFLRIAEESGLSIEQAGHLFDAARARGLRVSTAAEAERVAALAGSDAAILQSAGVRSAAVLQDAGFREESSLRTAGQRKVNLIWESTQAAIAFMVSVSTLGSAATLVFRGGADLAAFVLLSDAFFLVIGFYFGRTNHQRIGGVGHDDAGR